MKISVIILLISLLPQMILSQKILSLKECYDMAGKTNALAGEKEAYSSLSKIKDDNLLKGWLPELDANGSFIFNSSVIDMGGVLGSLPIPGIAGAIKPLPNEQYKVTLDINQVFYDGGVIKSARDLEKTDLRINQKQTETDLYKLRNQINSYYFSLLLLSRQKDLQNIYLELIRKRIFSSESAVENGMALRSGIDVLTSEKIRIEQQIADYDIKKASLLKILSWLTGTELDPSTQFILPGQTPDLTTELQRPELQMFDLRKQQLAAGMKLVESSRMPKAFGFATLGYGNPPGSNFFKNEFAPYYILGAGVKWNIFDWSKAKNEKQIIILQQGIIENRKNDLTDNLKRLLESKKAEIESMQTLLKTDDELISLRKRITASAESQYNNGTITATDYLNELNSEKQAVINFEIHKINLAIARIEYLNISGRDIE
jgi:outer membrane protein TolC